MGLDMLGALTSTLVVLAAAQGVQDDERFAGTAQSADGFTYLEEHRVRHREGRPLEAITRYLAPGGEVLATLRSDYSQNPYAPDYEFHDLRTGDRQSVSVTEKLVELRSARGVKRLARSECPNLTTGQGLDRLIRAHLDALARGERVRVSLALPAREACYPFRVRSAEVEPGASTLRVRVEPESWVLRLLAPKLEVEYDRASQRLLRYQGVSNLDGPDGESRKVEILYRYEDDGLAAP
jgi:hypothetical protein